MDFLDLLSDRELFPESGTGSADANTSILVPSHDVENPANAATSGEAVARPEHALVELAGPAPRRRRAESNGPRINSKGTPLERHAWQLAMRVKKLQKQKARSEQEVFALLSSLERKSSTESKVRVHRTKRGKVVSRHGLVKVSFIKQRTTGNQRIQRWSMRDFLIAAFGCDRRRGRRIAGRNAQAVALGMDPSTVAYFRSVSAGAVLARQSCLLARLYILCQREKPWVAGFDSSAFSLFVHLSQTAHILCLAPPI